MKKHLVILEMANNHMGDLEHGKLMITQFADIIDNYKKFFDFAWKFQFRDFDTFIHKDYKGDMNHKYIKRFTETSLSEDQFIQLKNYAELKGFKTLCTGFDENSIDLIEKMNFDVIKVASCSFTDWPLLNKIITTNKPIILSTAGATLEEIDRVVSFMQHRQKNISLMHCVGEYPTQINNLQLNQIDLLKERYPNVPIGYSTHEEPNEFNAIQIAISKGAEIYEKHVAVSTEKYSPNAYSVTPDQFDEWLKNAKKAIIMCGEFNKRIEASEKELSDLLQFKRGMFAKNKILKGSIIGKNDIYYSWPSIQNQVLANNASKYNQFIATEDIEPDQPVMFDKISLTNTRDKIWKIVQDIKNYLSISGVVYPGKAELEISHHYGLDKFYEVGITMITVVNREYCKKLIIVLPNQLHPEQYHLQKEETFVVLHGEVELSLNGQIQTLKKGDVVTIEKEVKHEFTTKTGCIIEEVSSTHYINDSYYTDKNIEKNKDRKTFITYWL
jgi:sialic acid synthase SpsE/quercetin dioxygenase-like cupin family protein